MDKKSPTLRSQAHCQVAQKTHRQILNLSISLPAPTRKKTPSCQQQLYAIAAAPASV